MLIKFESEHAGSFVMFSDVALPLIRMMGARGEPEGAVSEDELAAALQRLETGLQQHAGVAPEDGEEDPFDDDQDAQPGLSIRAAPLLDMLRRAKAHDGYVMWRPES